MQEEKDRERDKKAFEADQNLLGFFSILLQIDKRVNPQNYAIQKEEKDD